MQPRSISAGCAALEGNTAERERRNRVRFPMLHEEPGEGDTHRLRCGNGTRSQLSGHDRTAPRRSKGDRAALRPSGRVRRESPGLETSRNDRAAVSYTHLTLPK